MGARPRHRPDSTGNTTGAGSAAIKTIGGIPVGVQHSRAGALAAADNYVVVASDSIVQEPRRYTQLVQRAYAPGYQRTALREGAQLRAASPEAVQNYAAGGRGLTTVVARRVDTYSGRQAQITTWTVGTAWGPTRDTSDTWTLVETTLTWDGQRWLVMRLDEAKRDAPAPRKVRYDSERSFETETFDRELRGMSAPRYGAG